jgi:hypothetical protein
MKKTVLVLTAAILAAAFAACSLMGGEDWVETMDHSGNTAGTDNSTGEGDAYYSPIVFTVRVSKEGEASQSVSRSVAGAGAQRLRSAAFGTRNYIQVVVVNAAGELVDFCDSRQAITDQAYGDITLTKLKWDTSYRFLALMGHWPVSSITGNTNAINYDGTKPPTLLLVGLTTTTPQAKGGLVPITLEPLWVDTIFEGPKGRIREPELNSGTPQELVIFPHNEWKVRWRIRGSGFDNLVRAKDNLNATIFGNATSVGVSASVVGEKASATLAATPVDESWLDTDATNESGFGPWNLTYALGALALGNTGYVNFNVEYVPFKKTGTIEWTGFTSTVSDLNPASAVPKWIIRNGVNDTKQDNDTVFSPGVPWAPVGKNGNGGIRFKATEPVPKDVSEETGVIIIG